jgi:hypothetical protein
MAKRTWEIYQTLAVLFLNTLLCFLFGNGALYVIYQGVDAARGREEQAGALAYGDERLSQAYPGWARAERDALLTETWSRPYQCAPFVHYRETPYTGRYVNVHPAGYRDNGQGQAWPPAESTPGPLIFVFGGSTTFGYGVADAETIPAYLAELLPAGAQVYNFGAGSYYSTLELLSFQNLLRAGLRPDIAIFIDGINEGQTEPDRWREFICDPQAGAGTLSLNYNEWPVSRAADSFRYRLGLNAAGGEENSAGGGEEGDDILAQPLTSMADFAQEREIAAVEQWRDNRRMIQALGDEFGVAVLFVWQPDPRYQYPRESHLFPERLPPDEIYRHEYLLGLGVKNWPGVLFLAEIQAGRAEPLYVDALHYTAAFNQEIAGHIARALSDGGYLSPQ